MECVALSPMKVSSLEMDGKAGIRLVDRRAYSRVFGTPTWAGARQMSGLSDVSDTLLENGRCPPARTFSPEKNDKSENPKKIVNFSVFQVLKFSKSEGTLR